MLHFPHTNLNKFFHLWFLITLQLLPQDFLVCSLAFFLYGRQNNIEISFAYNLLLNQDILKSNLHIVFDNFRDFNSSTTSSIFSMLKTSLNFSTNCNSSIIMSLSLSKNKKQNVYALTYTFRIISINMVR